MGVKLRCFVGSLFTYTAYTSYTYIVTQKEIKFRESIYNQSSIEGNNDNDDRFKLFKIFGRFENPFEEYRPQTIYEFFIMRLIEFSKFESNGNLPSDKNEIRKNLPVFKTDLNFLKSVNELNKNVLTYTWFGQSCGLLQINGSNHVCKTFLLDPIFGNSIINKDFGPKRISPSPVQLNELYDTIRPDFILVSHDHPDHLEEESISFINNKSNWIVPIGLKSFLIKKGVDDEKITELKWWEKYKIDNEFEIICLPTMHWSGRNLIDSNTSLWCSYLILKNGKSIFYHGGDTGYVSKLFKKIGEMYGPIKFAALPIGQYCPEWHQKPRHISPSESIQIMKDMKIHKIVGVHWGTFVLSSENYLEPGKLLKDLSIKENKLNNIVVPKFGKTLVMDMDKLDFDKDDEIENFENYVVYK